MAWIEARWNARSDMGSSMGSGTAPQVEKRVAQGRRELLANPDHRLAGRVERPP
jgi:hypothetical protein